MKKNYPYRIQLSVLAGVAMTIAFSRCGPIASSIDKTKRAGNAANDFNSGAAGRGAFYTANKEPVVTLSTVSTDNFSENEVTQSIVMKTGFHAEWLKNLKQTGSTTVAFDNFVPKFILHELTVVVLSAPSKEAAEIADLKDLKIKFTLVQNDALTWTLSLVEAGDDHRKFLMDSIQSITLNFSGSTPVPAPAPSISIAPSPTPTPSESK